MDSLPLKDYDLNLWAETNPSFLKILLSPNDHYNKKTNYCNTQAQKEHPLTICSLELELYYGLLMGTRSFF